MIDRTRDWIDRRLSDRWATMLRWGLVYPLATVLLPLSTWALDPVVAGVLVLLVTLPAGFSLGIFGEDRRAERVATRSARAGRGTDRSRGLPFVERRGSRFRAEDFIAYVTGVTFFGLVALFVLAKLAFGL